MNTAMEWMGAGACLSAAELPWTTEPVARSDALVAAMADICRCCPVMETCAAYAAGYASAGFWAGTWHADDDRLDECGPYTEQPMLPLGELLKDVA